MRRKRRMDSPILKHPLASVLIISLSLFSSIARRINRNARTEEHPQCRHGERWLPVFHLYIELTNERAQ